jgi:hypothetical protein
MENTGYIRKMKSELESEEVKYHLPVGEKFVLMNSLIGKKLSIEFHQEIACIRCGRITPKSYHQGYCYPCFCVAPETEACTLHPEMCRAQEGISRDMAWSREHCLIEHVVYLSLTSDVKVGVTRHTQVPTRWIDQGAQQAVVFARVPDRQTAGLIEVDLKREVKDKTNWRNMLTGKVVDANLLKEKERLSKALAEGYQAYITNDAEVVRINYPGSHVPDKVTTWNPEKEATFEGTLAAIKGQYLIFENNTVWNVRKHNGYLVTLRY